MAYQKLGLGSSANDGTGDDLRTGGDKINDNVEELYAKINGVAVSAINNGTALTTDVVTLNTATQTLTNKTLTSPTITTGIVATSLDMNGGELILDADADTSITADTDDTINIKFGGNDRIDLSTGLISIKNDGSQSQLRLYCESSNAHYVALQAPAHADFSGNHIVTLPNTTQTLVGRTSTDTLTNKTLTSPDINGGSVDGAVIGGNTPAAITGTAISGTSVTVTGTAGAVTLPTLTTTQRNALSAANGMLVYNSTTSKIEAYAGGAWVQLH